MAEVLDPKTEYGLSFDLTIDKYEHILDSERVIYFFTEYNYMSSRYPLLMMKLAINLKEYVALRKLYTPDRPILDKIDLIIKEQVRNESKINTPWKVVATFNNMIGIVNKVDTITKEEIKSTANIDKTGAADHGENTTMIYIALFDKDDLTPFNAGFINGIFKNVTNNDMIMKIHQSCASSKIKISPTPSHNTEKFEQLIMPMYGYYEALEYLAENKTMYTEPYNIFLLKNKAYLYPLYGDINMESNKPEENLQCQFNIVENVDVMPGGSLKKYDDKVLDVDVSIRSVVQSGSYNPMARELVTANMQSILPPDPTLKYEFIHNIYTSNLVKTGKGKTFTRSTYVTIPLSGISAKLFIWAFTKIKLVGLGFDGDYRIRSYSAAYTKEGCKRNISVHKPLKI